MKVIKLIPGTDICCGKVSILLYQRVVITFQGRDQKPNMQTPLSVKQVRGPKLARANQFKTKIDNSDTS